MNPSALQIKRGLAGIAAGLVLLVYFAGSALTPFVLALIIAYALDPLVDRVEAVGLPRSLAILFFLFCILLVFSAGLFFLLPIVKLQVEGMARNLPDYIHTVQELLLPYVSFFTDNPERLRAEAQEMLTKLGNLPLNALESVASFSWSALSGFVNFAVAVFKMVIIPVAAFYLLRDIDRLKEKALDLIPLENRETALRIAGKLDAVLGNFIRGQLTVVGILAVIYCTGFFLVGIPMSLPLGILVGLAGIVPYLGLVLGFLPALILSYLQFHDFLHPLLVCGVFGMAQALEGMVITPKVVGDKLGLHPVAIMMAVLLGGQLFGFIGILLAVPVTAAINVFWSEGIDAYKRSEIYKGAV